jgi:hypothetical protein
MGILEIHFHDSEFSWSMNPGTDSERSLSLRTGSRSEPTTDGGGRRRAAIASKLGTVGVLALVVGAGFVVNRLRSRRAREAAATEAEESKGRWLSLSRSK